MDNLSEEELKRQKFISEIRTMASHFPQDLTNHYSVDELLIGIQDVDKNLGEGKQTYDKLLRREKNEDVHSAEYAHIQELKILVVRQLETYFDMAENLERALRSYDYIYGYETYMPDISDIIYKNKKQTL